MKIEHLQRLKCSLIEPYLGKYQEHKVLVIDTETVQGKPYTFQAYDGLTKTIEYVDEKTIFNCYCDYIASHYEKNMSVWFFYCQFDLPIIHYPFKEYFSVDNHNMGYGEFDFRYVTGKTWYGNHQYQKMQWFERDAYQYVFRGLSKVAKDLNLTQQKFSMPSFLGQRKWTTPKEQADFEAYALQDVIVLWELVYWILDLHRKFDVGLSVSLADLAGKIFRKHHVKKEIEPTNHKVTMAALSSYHGGKTEKYVEGVTLIKNIHEYDITSAYPFAMSQIGNFSDYDIQPWKKTQSIENNGVYQVSTALTCGYRCLYNEDFQRVPVLSQQWVTGWELQSALKYDCLKGLEICQGYVMVSHNEKENGLKEYVETFFARKQKADQEKNATERLASKLFLNALYGKFISKIQEEKDELESWKGGVIFHPLIATLITGFVRAYVHDIEHVSQCFHTSTDSFITKHATLDSFFPGVNGLGTLKKEYSGDALIIRPKVYVIFDSIDPDCHHKFDIDESKKVYCVYCQAKTLKSATHGFYGSIHMLLNMWKGGKTNYVVNRMVRLKEAIRRRDPDVLPFVFTNHRRSLNVDWSTMNVRR